MAATSTLRKRAADAITLPEGLGHKTDIKAEDHPAGEIKHGQLLQIIRGFAIMTYFIGGSIKYVLASCFSS
jgi:hypothetical protein